MTVKTSVYYQACIHSLRPDLARAIKSCSILYQGVTRIELYTLTDSF